MASKSEIEVVLFKLSGVFPKEISFNGIDTYFEMLSDLSSEQLSVSLKACLLECKFFPSISEIREKCIVENSDAKISELFFKVVDSYNEYKPTEYPSEIVRKAMNAVGGIKFLAKKSDRDLMFSKKDFVAYYKDYQKEAELLQLESGTGNVKLLDFTKTA